MIIHINQDRFERILDQGWNLSAQGALVQMPGVKLSSDTKGRFPDLTHYHLLSGEHGYCLECDSEFDSVVADTPVDLEVAKEQMRRAN